MKNTFFKIFVMLLVGASFVQSCTKEEPKQTPASKATATIKTEEVITGPAGANGTKAADFSLINLVGEEVTLNQFKGKVIMLNFWASWCGPCKAEIPDFIKMYNIHQKDGLEIIGVALSSGSAENIKQFVDQWNINYPILTGDEKYLQDLTNKYGGIRGVPTTFLIDRKGIIQQKWVGARTEQVFMAEVEKYL